jgi:hypothetical protein
MGKLTPGWEERFAQFERETPYRVLISDPTDKELVEIHEFINNAKLELVSVDGVDVSDHSLTTDMIYEYVFANAEDALMFTLKWKK